MLLLNHAGLVVVNIINNSTRFTSMTLKQSLLYANMMTYTWVIISTGIVTYP
jgi:hypothetical protein